MQKQQRTGKRGNGRPRQEKPKVWHNPDVVTGPRPGSNPNGPPSRPEASPSGRGRGGSEPNEPTPTPSPVRAQKIVRPLAARDPKELELERLVARLIAAEGRPAITRAADAVEAAGFELPVDQGVQLQLLEHSNEGHVEAALGRLARLLAVEPCKRPTVLESRLRRLEEFADEASTRLAARDLRRQVSGRLDPTT